MLRQVVDTLTPCVLSRVSTLLCVSGSIVPDLHAMADAAHTLGKFCSARASCGTKEVILHMLQCPLPISIGSGTPHVPGGPNRRAALPLVLRALALLPDLRARGPAAAAHDVDEAATARFHTASFHTVGPCRHRCHSGSSTSLGMHPRRGSLHACACPPKGIACSSFFTAAIAQFCRHPSEAKRQRLAKEERHNLFEPAPLPFDESTFTPQACLDGSVCQGLNLCKITPEPHLPALALLCEV
eukprot:4349385-Amphidinium_carterae.2